jgi:hypothetical protein
LTLPAEAMRRLTDTAEGDWRAAATFLALRWPERWWPPPEDVTLVNLMRWTGCTEEEAERWLGLPTGSWPPDTGGVGL